ncbi:hypothetical protein [Heliorestis convoluta]|uniref:Uncharacterized protein n=1 Tax=Heliorestis convoluta TaxID=356322 RepID=A0A5Q2N7V5_9FIRM|nr:hypothetical protein [Heliorestis convoluta]QGG48340.1 hypothetical protein FTV88_2242 [Heliorestis convoluta]
MGIYINLNFMPHQITEDRWNRLYQETLELLQAYPFASIRLEDKGRWQIAKYCRAKDEEVHEKTRHWEVCGDLESLKIAESFRLAYNLDHYKSFTEESQSSDILEELCKGFREQRNMASIFDSKTQGCPYHIYVLALAMLIETRLAPFASVHGDFTREQALKAKSWADEIVTKPLNMPVLVDSEKMYQRLSQFLSGQALFDAFYHHWNGPEEEALRILFDKNVAERDHWFLSQLKNYESSKQIGVLRLYIQWLNNKGDLERLAQLACIEKEGPCFSPVEFAKSLCSTWVFLEPSTYEVMDYFKESPDVPGTVEGQFGTILLELKYTGRNIQRYIPLEEGLSVLVRLFPEQKEEIEQQVRAEVAKYEKDLNDMNRLAAEKDLEEDIEYDDDGLVGDDLDDDLDVGDLDVDDLGVDDLNDDDMAAITSIVLEGDMSFFLYYREGSVLLKPQKLFLEMIAYQAKVYMQGCHSLYEKMYSKLSSKKEVLFATSSQKGICLTEEAWKRIEEDADTEAGLLIFTYMVVELDPAMPSGVRRGILENRQLRQKLLDLMKDDAVMVKIEQYAEEVRGTQS